MSAYDRGAVKVGLVKNLFIFACMVIIAASLGFSFWAQSGISTGQAITTGVAILSGQLIAYLMIWKSFVYRTLSKKINELAVQESHTALQIERLGNELQNLRASVPEVVKAGTSPIAQELQTMGDLVSELAESAAENDTRVERLAEELAEIPDMIPSLISARLPASPPPPAVYAPPQQVAQVHKDHPAPVPQPVEDTHRHSFRDVSDFTEAYPGDYVADILEDEPVVPEKPKVHISPLALDAVKRAIDESAVDVYLQPIVTLPQRSTKFYEAVTRLKAADGTILQPTDYRAAAEHDGTMPILDKMLLVRTVQVLRRLLERKPDITLICSLSASSLADGKFFSDFKRLLNTHKELINHLIFEFDQQTTLNLGPLEEESLRALQSLGFMFAVNDITNLNMDYRRLSGLGFHYVKVSFPMLIAARETGVNDIHAEDFSRFMKRNAMQVIVEQIDREADVIQLLDFDIGLGQGALFGGPREVRPDAAKRTAPPEPVARVARA